jgi:hypothetical protein
MKFPDSGPESGTRTIRATTYAAIFARFMSCTRDRPLLCAAGTTNPNLDEILQCRRSRRQRHRLPRLFLDLNNLDGFIEAEQGLFQKVGIRPLWTVNALSTAMSIGQKIDYRKIDSDALEQDIEKLRKSACSLKNEILTSQKWSAEKPLLLIGLVGISFVVADGIGTYLSIGGLAPVAHLSVTLGAEIIVSAASKLATD